MRDILQGARKKTPVYSKWKSILFTGHKEGIKELAELNYIFQQSGDFWRGNHV